MIGIYDTAIVDEAHFLRNWKSKQSEAIFKIKATYRYPLTGTPSVKHGSDVYGLLHFINPERYSVLIGNSLIVIGKFKIMVGAKILPMLKRPGKKNYLV
jgi:SNF2 family DNA or RNA helicase